MSRPGSKRAWPRRSATRSPSSCAPASRSPGSPPASPSTPADVAASKGKLQVALLPDAPGKHARKEALALATDEDLLAIEGSELYWLPSGGICESELDLKTLEAELGPWTMRTMGTVEQIAAKHCGG